MRRARAMRVALAAPALLALVAQAAIAQQTHPAGRAGAGAAPHKGRAPARTAHPHADAGAPGPAPAAVSASAPAASSADGGANVLGEGPRDDSKTVEVKTLDGGTQVFKFGELDIEGRLKSPQLVYFLRRVRAQLAAGDLGHRTFIPEMLETRKEPLF